MLEYFVVLYEYYKTSKKSYLYFNFFVSILISFLVFLVSDRKEFADNAEKLISNIIGVLGILIGFAISMFTLLNTASNANIEEIKKMETGCTLYKKPFYLFDLLVVSMVYIIIIESLLLILNILFPFFFTLTSTKGILAFCFSLFLLIHVVLVNVSTTVDFYFVISKK